MIRIPELGKPEESGRLPGSVVGTVNGHGGEDLRLELGSLAECSTRRLLPKPAIMNRVLLVLGCGSEWGGAE
jgi:hypothetical protein